MYEKICIIIRFTLLSYLEIDSILYEKYFVSLSNQFLIQYIFNNL